MKKILLGVALALIAASCVHSPVIRGNGHEVRGEFDISLNYTELSVSSGIVVELVASEKGAGFITADEAVLEYVSIVEEDGRVKISYEPFVSVRSDIETRVTMPLSAAVSKLEASSAASIESGEKLVCTDMRIDGSSAGRVDLDIESAERLTIDLSSAAHFTGNVVARDLIVEVTSAAGCEIEGNADYCRVEATSAGNFRGSELVCRRAGADASSGAGIELAATEELDASASSGGTVRYRGEPPMLRRDTSSGGTIREMN